MPYLVRPLFSGPLDLVGDVHGGLSHLQSLFEKLGYDPQGHHPSRRLIFLGDLVDRGEDSPGVIQLVRSLVNENRAQCVMGNHELNLLLGKERPGNEWFYGKEQFLEDPHQLLPQKLLPSSLQSQVEQFFNSLPLALEREDLRVVHACWDSSSINELREQKEAAVFLRERNKINKAPILATNDRTLRALIDQNENPVKVVTSGLEQAHKGPPFVAGGKQRKTTRVAWWAGYKDPQAVVFGHYWRSRTPLERLSVVPSPFGDEDNPFSPLGPLNNAWCVDFSNGHRAEEALRRPERRDTVACLAALRWPEQEFVLA
ncbi:MAG: metallophosphoesterase [Planctomycetota bacterium]|nr:metallophosphoesterase [Planctomycetota bacterium]